MATNDDIPFDDAAAGGTGAIPVTSAPPPPPQTRRRRTSLAARGEPAVWLTGGAAALSVLMIAGLFLLVGVYGLGTFWPGPVSRVVYEPTPGTTASLLGEPFRDDVRMVDGVADPLTLWRTGNRDLNDAAFTWVVDSTIVETTRPRDVLVVERVVDGPAMGTLEAVAIDGRLYEGFDAAWPALTSTLDEVRDLGERIEAIKYERGTIGEERAEIDARLAAARGDAPPPEGETDEAAAEDAPSAEVVAEAEATAEREQAELAARDQALRAEQADLERQVSRFRVFVRDESGKTLAVSRGQRSFNVSARTVLPPDEADRVASVRRVDFTSANTRAADPADPLMGDASMASPAEQPGAVVVVPTGDDARRPALQFVDAEGDPVGEPYALAPLSLVTVADNAEVAIGTRVAVEPLAMTLGQIVRAYPPNQLGFLDKLGVYFSRWGEYLTARPRDANMEGGVWPHIVGTVLLTFIMIVFVVPIGVVAAIYLREYARQGPLVSLVRICVNNLAGVPSIVYGVFGLGFFCYGVGGWIDGGARGASVEPLTVPTWILFVAIGVILAALAVGLTSLAARADKGAASDDTLLPKTFRLAAGVAWATSAAIVFFFVVAAVPTSIYGGFHPETLGSGASEWKGQALIWASMTLALLTLPVVIVATEEALASVPRSMREGSYACGASKWQTIRTIVLPRALPGIMTGAILAIARGAGEVAPIMLVGALKLVREMPVNGERPFVHLDQAFMHLGFHIFDLGFQSPDAEAARAMVYTTTLLLIAIVLLLNIAAIWLRSRLRRAFSGGAF